MLATARICSASGLLALGSCNGVAYKGPPRAEYFSPSARIYFDVGEDEEEELDLFQDGSLAPAIDFISLTWPFSWGNMGPPDTTEATTGTELKGGWRWGPRVGAGFTSPASDSEDGEAEASGAPVLYISASLMSEFLKSNDDSKAGVLFEFGVLHGISADESLSDADDTAIYVGLTAHL
jgi:hypothetical protein